MDLYGMRWLRIRTRNCFWNGLVSHLFEAVHCHPSSVDNIVCKCSSSPLTRWLWIPTRNCCWNGFAPNSLETFHFHPSLVYNIDSKCSSVVGMEMSSNSSWKKFVPHFLPAVHCDPYSSDNLDCKCCSILLITWLCSCLNGFVWLLPQMFLLLILFEAVHGHLSSMVQLVRKCHSTSGLISFIRWVRIKLLLECFCPSFVWGISLPSVFSW